MFVGIKEGSHGQGEGKGEGGEGSEIWTRVWISGVGGGAVRTEAGPEGAPDGFPEDAPCCRANRQPDVGHGR